MAANGSAAALPKAIVIGLDCETGLQTARVLSARGVAVMGIARDKTHFCCRTNTVESVVDADTGTEKLIEAVRRLATTLPAKPVLYPCTDLAVRTLSRYRKRIEDCSHLLLCDHEVVETLSDKGRFYRYAQRNALPIPATQFVRSRDDAETLARHTTFPCVLKPTVKTQAWGNDAHVKALKASSPEEMLALYGRYGATVDEMVVQEWIPGREGYEWCAYFDASSEPVATCTLRKIRQWPPDVGTSSLAVECDESRLADLAAPMLRSLGFSGLCNIEFKRDPRTGSFVIIECNIGRPALNMTVAEASGIEMIYAPFAEAVGHPVPRVVRPAHPGAKWIYWKRDLASALHYARRGELTLASWLRSVRGRKMEAVFSWTDPAPFLADLLRTEKIRARLATLAGPSKANLRHATDIAARID